jgi:hypothetical protein
LIVFSELGRKISVNLGSNLGPPPPSLDDYE